MSDDKQTDGHSIGMDEFFELPEIKAQVEIEKHAGAFGSTPHRNAHIEILRIAESHGVAEYFESLADYDESVKRINS